MPMKKSKRIVTLVMGLLAVTVIALSPVLIRETSKANFCISCHVMESQYEDWFKSGLHRSLKCVECHLPHDNLFNHLLWKAVDGTKDVISFYGRLYPDHITISSHGSKTIQANCLRCHEDMVSMISLDDKKNCWTCHRRTNHTHPISGLNSS